MHLPFSFNLVKKALVTRRRYSCCITRRTAQLAKKGQEVIVEGQLRRNDWETEDGQKHSKHFVKAESWQFTQAKAKATQKAKDDE